MYAAHAEKKRKESSQICLEECLSQLETAKSDNDRFIAILEITECVQTNSFTDLDRSKVLKAMGCDFLTKLITTSSVPSGCPKDLCKAMALTVLSVACVDANMMMNPAMKDFVPEVNGILTSAINKSHGTPLDGLHTQMCEDCVSIVSHLSQHTNGVQLLSQCACLPVLLDFVLSPVCVKPMRAVSSISRVVKLRGDSVFLGREEQFHSIMGLAVDSLVSAKDMLEKCNHSKILTELLSGMSVMTADENTQWVVKLASCLKKLLVVKLNQESGETLLLLTCGLVSGVSAAVLGPAVTRDATLLKTVVARLSVEVYCLLDGITPGNAIDRYPIMDKIYKCVCTLVQYVADQDTDSGSPAFNTDTIISVYRKLVDISTTLMEFLYSVFQQEIQLPRNHVCVILSVRTLAAMLTEITEEPTVQLLELLPFFNLLCQTVDYSDEVKMEVKNATQAALANIKMMGMNLFGESDVIHEDEEEEVEEKTNVSVSSTEGNSSGSSQWRENMNNNDNNSRSSNMSEKKLSNASSEGRKNVSFSTDITNASCDETPLSSKTTSIESRQKVETHQHSSDTTLKSELDNSINNLTLSDKDVAQISQQKNSPKKTLQSHTPETDLLYGDTRKSAANDLHENNGADAASAKHLEQSSSNCGPSIVIHPDSIQRYSDFIRSIQESKSKPPSLAQRQGSFIGKAKKKQKSDGEETPQWQPDADDVLGFLLPTYAFLLEHDEALRIMVRCQGFHTITNFIQKSLSQALESESSIFPESSTSNALGVVEQVYSNWPATAAELDCFQDLFEISVLSVPNLVSLSNPPALVCLKLIEVTLAAYRLQMRGHKRNSAIPRLKHSQSRFFRAAVDYLSSFYAYRQSKRHQSLVLHIVRKHHDAWPVIEEAWCGSLAGLCTLVRNVGDLQDAFLKSLMIPEFMTFLKESNDTTHQSSDVHRLVESLLSLLESAGDSSEILSEMLLHNDGLSIASKFGLQKLSRCLQNKLTPNMASSSGRSSKKGKPR